MSQLKDECDADSFVNVKGKNTYSAGTGAFEHHQELQKCIVNAVEYPGQQVPVETGVPNAVSLHKYGGTSIIYNDLNKLFIL